MEEEGELWFPISQTPGALSPSIIQGPVMEAGDAGASRASEETEPLGW